MNEPYLIGKCNETGRTIIFLTKQGANIGSYNSVLFVDIFAYIHCKSEKHQISKMSFTCAELDCIYPVTQGFNCTIVDEEFHKNGVLSVSTEDYDTTTTEQKIFIVEEKDVAVTFGISRTFSTKVGDPPLTLHSTMSFKFEPTEDYTFITKLWFVAKEFLQFMCYRKNVYIPIVELYTPTEEGKSRAFATLNILNENGKDEHKALQKGRFINLLYLSGKEGDILNDISARLLYTRHIPETYTAGNSINEARFVMITAAFEWEFGRKYPNGIPKSQDDIEIETTATNAIQKLIDESTGALKKKYKFLRYMINKSDPLEKKLIQIGKDFDAIIGPFGKHLYSLNNTELIYSEMGKRLADQRNHYAHGDLDIEFIEKSLLDLIYTERIVYAMQLKFYNIDDKNVQKAINDLFGCGIIIK